MGGIGGIVMALLNVDAHTTLDSSVGRAVDCSCKCQTSIGRWFKSGSREFFLGPSANGKPLSVASHPRGTVPIPR